MKDQPLGGKREIWEKCKVKIYIYRSFSSEKRYNVMACVWDLLELVLTTEDLHPFSLMLPPSGCLEIHLSRNSLQLL